MHESQLKLNRNAVENIAEFEGFLSVTWAIYHLWPQGGPRLAPAGSGRKAFLSLDVRVRKCIITLARTMNKAWIIDFNIKAKTIKLLKKKT